MLQFRSIVKLIHYVLIFLKMFHWCLVQTNNDAKCCLFFAFSGGMARMTMAGCMIVLEAVGNMEYVLPLAVTFAGKCGIPGGIYCSV